MLNVVFNIAVITVIIYIPKAWLSISASTVQIKPVHWVGRILGGISVQRIYVCALLYYQKAEVKSSHYSDHLYYRYYIRKQTSVTLFRPLSVCLLQELYQKAEVRSSHYSYYMLYVCCWYYTRKQRSDLHTIHTTCCMFAAGIIPESRG